MIVYLYLIYIVWAALKLESVLSQSVSQLVSTEIANTLLDRGHGLDNCIFMYTSYVCIQYACVYMQHTILTYKRLPPI